MHVYGTYTRAAINYPCMRNIAPAFNYALITKSSLSIKFLIKSTAFSLTPRGFGAHPAARFSLKPVWPVAFSIWLIIGLWPVFVAICNATIIPQNALILRSLGFISHRETRACLLSGPKYHQSIPSDTSLKWRRRCIHLTLTHNRGLIHQEQPFRWRRVR